jgi:hypothetical protein
MSAMLESLVGETPAGFRLQSEGGPPFARFEGWGIALPLVCANHGLPPRRITTPYLPVSNFD